MQAEFADPTEYFPGAHVAHFPFLAYKPGPHATHDDARLVRNAVVESDDPYPSGQDVHDKLPTDEEYLPAEHGAQIEESYSHTTPASSLLGFDGLPLSIMSFIQSLLASLHADEHPKAIDASVPVQRKPAYCVA